MNRNQGITAGAILAAGLMLRPTASVAPVSMVEHGGEAAASKTVAGRADEDGPWLASCKYWAPVREVPTDSRKKKTTVKISIQQEDGVVESETDAEAEEDDPECPVDEAKGITRWGFRPEKGPLQPKIHAIIATVRDPLHTHLALDFDREIDALIMAAGDNGYLPSYYWLPWKVHAGSLPAEITAGGEGTEHNAARERQPGLIVFKKVYEIATEEKQALQANYSEAIYLFLIGESPALGVDGFQLRNAFHYEKELAAIRGVAVNFSMSAYPGLASDLAVIGPTNSGSAASLRAAIEALRANSPSVLDLGKDPLGFPAALPGPNIKGRTKAAPEPGVQASKRNVDIAGTTQTQLASDLLSAPSSLGGMSRVKYVSFSENWKFEEKDLLQSLVCSGYRLNRIAELSEDGTVYGNQGSQLPVSQDKVSELNKVSELIDLMKTACPENKSATYNPKEAPLILRFPRNISLLRNAHPGGDQQDIAGKSTPTPFLHLSLRDSGTNDSVPQFSPDQMPLSQEAQLMSIGRLLERAHVQFILVQASNVLDGMFLERVS